MLTAIQNHKTCDHKTRDHRTRDHRTRGQSRSLRRGIQLLELVISLTTSSILVAGISAAIFMSTRGKELADEGKSESELWMALDRFASDVAEAKEFFTCTDQSVIFEVADRDGDNTDELIEYSWSPGNALQYTYNGAGTPVDVTDPLDTLDMRWRTSPPQEESADSSIDPPGQYLYQSHRAKWVSDGFWILGGVSNTVTIPETYQAGDLLVAAITTGKRQSGDITTNSSWTKIFQTDRQSGNFSLAVFYTFAPSGSSVSFSYPTQTESHAVVGHFQSPTSTGFMDDFATNEGNSGSPGAPAALASSPNSLVVRVIGTRQKDVLQESSHISGHMPIYFRSGSNERPTVGIAVQSLATSGTVPAANFNLSGTNHFATGTLVFAP